MFYGTLSEVFVMLLSSEIFFKCPFTDARASVGDFYGQLCKWRWLLPLFVFSC